MQTKNPVIWKKEKCLVGQCKNLHDKHWWSIPFTASYGLVTECFNCGKLRKVRIED